MPNDYESEPTQGLKHARRWLLLLMTGLLFGSRVMLWRDRESITARILAIMFAGIYLSDAIVSGRLHHSRLHREFARETSPVGFWSFVAVGFLILIVLIIECLHHVSMV
jgi:hypothetical protein